MMRRKGGEGAGRGGAKEQLSLYITVVRLVLVTWLNPEIRKPCTSYYAITAAGFTMKLRVDGARTGTRPTTLGTVMPPFGLRSKMVSRGSSWCWPTVTRQWT